MHRQRLCWLLCFWLLLSAAATWPAPEAQPAPSSERDAELRKRLLLLIESLDICDSDWSRQDERLLSTLSLTEKLKLQLGKQQTELDASVLQIGSLQLLLSSNVDSSLKLSQDLLAATTESGQLRSSLSTASSSLAQMRGLLRRDRLRTALIAGGAGLAAGILLGVGAAAVLGK